MSITRINNNIAALNANRNLEKNGRVLQQSIERLSSGLRINRAGDDAAGMTIATRIRSQVKGLDRAIMNAQDGINLINVAEGAMEEMIQRLDRIRVLSIQAANTGVNDFQARQALQDEVFQSIDEITRIANTTQYSKNTLLNGNFNVDAQIKPGQDGAQNFGVHIDSGPSAATLENGTHYLNIIRTQTGYASFIPGLNTDTGVYAMHTGVTNATDIAVSMARFTRVATGGGAGLLAQSVASGDTIVGGGVATTFFNGVSIHRTDIFSFEGVLADGVTKFSGALSLAGGPTFVFGDNGDATVTATELLGAINNAIDRAELALFGVNSSNSVPTAYRTTVTLADSTAGNANEGRLLLVSSGEFINQSNINITLARGGDVVTQSNGVVRSGTIGGNSALSGSGQIGNGVTAITGSTFGTGEFTISVEDVVGAQNRTVESKITFLDSSGSIINRSTSLMRTNGSALKLNGTFVGSVYTNGVSITSGDTVILRGVDADGTTFQSTFTFSLTSATDTALNDFQFASISGLIAELNYRTRDYTGATVADGVQTRFESALFTFSSDGKLKLIDDIARSNSRLNFTLTFNDSSSSATPSYTLQDKADLINEGFAESATFRVNGGPALRAEAGQVVTAYGPEPTREKFVREHLTFRVGSNLSVGTDTVSVEGHEFVGRLNGGPAVTFQNGEQDVVFIDDGSSGLGVAKFLTIDFDSILDITAAPDETPDPGTTIQISVVNRSINFHIGAFSEQAFRTSIGDLSAQNLGFGRGSGRTIEDINITTLTGANAALTIIDQAMDQINRTRSLLGAATNRLESTVSNLSVSSENLLASESRLRDADLARETTTFTQNQILVQAGTSILAQANFLPQGFLSLLG